MKLGEREHFILQQLADSPRFGLDLIKASDGLLKRGTIYVYLYRLEEKELIRSEIADRFGRRLYSITSAGLASASASAGQSEDQG
jgi:DNA-binding PadR family transcriptional regulator